MNFLKMPQQDSVEPNFSEKVLYTTVSQQSVTSDQFSDV